MNLMKICVTQRDFSQVFFYNLLLNRSDCKLYLTFLLKDELDLTAVHRKAMFDLSAEKKWQIYCSRRKVAFDRCCCHNSTFSAF